MSVFNISFYVILLSVAFAQFTVAVPDSECTNTDDDVDGVSLASGGDKCF
ncbi:hypothetical protein F4604DRAFT_1914581 [Suillus subluteus]|nr:hypothetical protein F4604DRAFT_1914581 [Suillus subluteus]